MWEGRGGEQGNRRTLQVRRDPTPDKGLKDL